MKLDLLPRQLNKLNYPSYSDRDRLYFSIYLRLALTQNDHLVKVHRSFDLFFKTPHRRNWIYLQVGRLENRWLGATRLIFNLNYFRFSCCHLGNFTIAQELFTLNRLALNSTIHDKLLSKQTFFYRNGWFKNLSTPLIGKLKLFSIDTFFFYDISYHYREIIFCRNLNLFTISLVSMSFNLWDVDYPIPLMGQNKLNFLLFFKLFFSIYLVVKRKHFQFKLDLWRETLYLKNNN